MFLINAYKPYTSFIVFIAMIVLLSFTGCNSTGMTRSTGMIRGTISAERYINLNIKSQSAPVEIRIYHLRDNKKFSASSYRQLTLADRKTLGSDLIRAESIILHPTETLPYNTALDPATRYIGIVGHFRDAKRNYWRGLHKVSLLRKENLNVSVRMNGIYMNQVVRKLYVRKRRSMFGPATGQHDYIPEQPEHGTGHRRGERPGQRPGESVAAAEPRSRSRSRFRLPTPEEVARQGLNIVKDKLEAMPDDVAKEGLDAVRDSVDEVRERVEDIARPEIPRPEIPSIPRPEIPRPSRPEIPSIPRPEIPRIPRPRF